MTRTTRRSVRVPLATVAIVSSALLVPAVQAAQAGGLRDCVDITGPRSGQVGCWEDVWLFDIGAVIVGSVTATR